MIHSSWAEQQQLDRERFRPRDGKIPVTIGVAVTSNESLFAVDVRNESKDDDGRLVRVAARFTTWADTEVRAKLNICGYLRDNTIPELEALGHSEGVCREVDSIEVSDGTGQWWDRINRTSLLFTKVLPLDAQVEMVPPTAEGSTNLV